MPAMEHQLLHASVELGAPHDKATPPPELIRTLKLSVQSGFLFHADE